MTESKEAKAVDNKTVITKLTERLDNIGINASRTCLPRTHDDDYVENGRDTFQVLSMALGANTHDQLRYEVLRKFRMGSRIVHPDKLHTSQNMLRHGQNT